MLRVLLIVSALLPGACAAARGQAVHIERVLLNEHEIAAFERIFSTTAAQSEAARQLVTAAQSQVAASDEVHTLKPDDRRTKEALDSALRRSAPEHVNVDSIRSDLLRDLASLLTHEQLGAWPKFEYFRTRERVLYARFGGSRDRTNLLALIHAVGVRPEEHAGLPDLLDTYERELDAILIELERAQGAAVSAVRGHRDVDAAAGAYLHATRQLVEHNLHYVRRVCATVPADTCVELRTLYDRSSLETAYTPNAIDLAIRAAPALEELDEPTREAVAKLSREYAPKYDELSTRIADMERLLRDSGRGFDRGAFEQLRAERRGLVRETREKLYGMLKPEQCDALLESGRKIESAWRAKMTR